jgi:hypothetical protein
LSLAWFGASLARPVLRSTRTPVRVRYDRAVRWQFVEDTVEDTGSGMLHLPAYRTLDPDVPLVVHPAGSWVERDVAPQECWTCRPEMFLVLGV